ncbi:unnamed protein product [Symbiodinium natans]|uniref:Uncharacterized protein n=1 Tax=Symbiodinium natans TaxID=878477 RepID=A0A812HCM0_9DINO|nr:unnamed protein product [Symbiodinium natans]
MSQLPQAVLILLAGLALTLSRLTTFATPTGSSSPRRDFLKSMTAGLAAGVGTQAIDVHPAQAAITRWSGLYKDPVHPGCERGITKDGDEFVISGTSAVDGSKACEKDAKTKKWYLIARKGSEGVSDELIIDFSPKGGPKDAVAKWDGDGIVFPDGNRWSKIKRKPEDAADSYLDGPTSPLSKFR